MRSVEGRVRSPSARAPQHLDLGFQSVAETIPFQVKVVGGLEIQPEPVGGPKEPRQAERGVGGDGTLRQDDLVHPPWRDVEILREAVLGQPERLEEVLEEDLSGMDGRQFPGDASLRGSDEAGAVRLRNASDGSSPRRRHGGQPPRVLMSVVG